MIIIIPLITLITGIICLTLVAIATQIDGGAAIASVASNHKQGIFIVFFIINMAIVFIITSIGYSANSRSKKKLVAITNTLSIGYKAIIIGVYGFIWGTFMCIPALASGGLLGIIEQFFNFIGSLIIPFVHLAIQVLIWIPVLMIEEFIAHMKENAIFNIIVRVVGCAVCTYLASKWLFGHSVPYLLDISGRGLIENIYGEDIFNTLEKMRIIN